MTRYLYDALFYVYARAMLDYVTPLVEMLGLVCKVMQLPRSPVPDETALEPLIVNASTRTRCNRARGTYCPDRAKQAKRDLYAFLFHVCSGT